MSASSTNLYNNTLFYWLALRLISRLAAEHIVQGVTLFHFRPQGQRLVPPARLKGAAADAGAGESRQARVMVTCSNSNTAVTAARLRV